MKNNRAPVILDEIQFVPALCGAIKRELERNRTPSQYILTGSQQWSVIKNLSDSLAGRAVFLDMCSFSLHEVAQLNQSTSIATGDSWLKRWLIFESAVVDHIRKLASVLDMVPTFYHWRSHGGAVVDLIIELDGRLFPIEIKGKSHVGKLDCRGITAFRETYPKFNIAPGLVVYLGDTFHQISDQDYGIPWDVI